MPPAQANKEKGDNPPPKPGTRSNSSVTTPADLQEIKDADDGRKFLEKFSLLCPPGEPTTNGSLAACLHQISIMSNTPKRVANAVRAVALMLEETEEMAINDTIREAFNSHLTEHTSDMQMLVDDVNTKIDSHLKEALEKLTKATADLSNSVPANPAGTAAGTGLTTTTMTYATALISPPPHANPRLAAKESIKARQFLLLGIKESAFGQLDPQQLKAEFNKQLKNLNVNEGKIRSVILQKEGSTLIEVDSDALAKWFANQVNKVEFSSIFGDEVKFKSRSYNVLALNAPTNLIPELEEHREEINETNGWARNTVAAIRWAKPISKRSTNQRSAHLILTFVDPESANRAISNGTTICNRRCRTERVRREPLRCLKCQGWNHMARDCTETKDKCSNCAENHRSEECGQLKSLTRCVSCQTSNHASWSRECPTFLRKVEELNERNPENRLPFFPTTEPWTWTVGNTNPSPATTTNNAQKKGNTNSKKQEKAKEPPRRYNTNAPDYARWTATDDGIPPAHHSWWDDDPPANGNIGTSRSTGLPNIPSNATQPIRIHSTSTNSSNTAGPSKLTSISSPKSTPTPLSSLPNSPNA